MDAAKLVAFGAAAAGILALAWQHQKQRTRGHGQHEQNQGKSCPLAGVEKARKKLNGRKALCVFLGSSAGNKTAYVLSAERLGKMMAERNIALVYGGGDVGLMGAVARNVAKFGGTVIGIIPKALAPRELSGSGVQPENTILTESMHDRKAIMASLADGFIVLPGGFGTMEEALEVITWTQLGVHRKTVGFLNIAGFWDQMRDMFKYAQEEGFIQKEKLGITIFENRVESLLDKMETHEPPKGLSQSWTSAFVDT